MCVCYTLQIKSPTNVIVRPTLSLPSQPSFVYQSVTCHLLVRYLDMHWYHVHHRELVPPLWLCCVIVVKRVDKAWVGGKHMGYCVSVGVATCAGAVAVAVERRGRDGDEEVEEDKLVWGVRLCNVTT